MEEIFVAPLTLLMNLPALAAAVDFCCFPALEQGLYCFSIFDALAYSYYYAVRLG